MSAKKTVKSTKKPVIKVTDEAKKLVKSKVYEKKEEKVFTEDQICKIACMVFMLESQIARMVSACGLYLGDEINKYDLLKEYGAVDRTMRRLTKDFHKEIEETIGKFRVFATDEQGSVEIKDGGVYATEND